jgi:hypothetical protein
MSRFGAGAVRSLLSLPLVVLVTLIDRLVLAHGSSGHWAGGPRRRRGVLQPICGVEGQGTNGCLHLVINRCCVLDWCHGVIAN